MTDEVEVAMAAEAETMTAEAEVDMTVESEVEVPPEVLAVAAEATTAESEVDMTVESVVEVQPQELAVEAEAMTAEAEVEMSVEAVGAGESKVEVHPEESAVPTLSPSDNQRMVRFVAETENEVYILEVDDEADAERTLAQDEYNERKVFRRREANVCKEKGYGILLMDSFEDPVAHVQKHMNVYCQIPDPFCGRGLERQVSSKHDWERREWRSKCVQNVLTEESKLRYSGGWNDEDDIWDKIASVSRKASRCAKRFARRMGKADEYVVHKGGEMYDLEEAVSLINEIRALQMKMNFDTARLMISGGEPPSAAASVRSSRSLGRRSSCGSSCPTRRDSLTLKSNSSNNSRRRSLRRSMSDRAHDRAYDRAAKALERALDRTPLDFDDDVSERRRQRRKSTSSSLSLGSSNSSLSSRSVKSEGRRRRKSTRSGSLSFKRSSSEKGSLLNGWGSFRSLGGAERGVDSLPGFGRRMDSASTPIRPNLMPSTSWCSSPSSSLCSSPKSVTDHDDDQSSGRRPLMKRWNSWSIASPNNSVKSLKKGSTQPSPTNDPQKQQGFVPPPSFSPASPTGSGKVEKEEEEKDVYGASNDFEDSLYFNRRRKKRARKPKLATLEEGENSFNTDLSNSNNSSASTCFTNNTSFFAKWGVPRKRPEDTLSGGMDDSNCSLGLSDIGLSVRDEDISIPGCASNDSSHHDDDSSTLKEDGKAEITPKRRGEDSGPVAPPSTRWRSSSMPVLSSMPEDSPKEYPLPCDDPAAAATKVMRLRKAEQWAMAKSTSSFNTVDEDNQSMQQILPSDVSMSEVEEVEDVNQDTKKKSKGGKFKKFLKRLSSSFRLKRKKEEPAKAQDTGKQREEEVPSDTRTKTNKHPSLLTRWASSSTLGKKKKKSLEGQLPVKSLICSGHQSSPALFGIDSRKCPERTASNSTVETNSTAEVDFEMTPFEQAQAARQNMLSTQSRSLNQLHLDRRTTASIDIDC